MKYLIGLLVIAGLVYGAIVSFRPKPATVPTAASPVTNSQAVVIEMTGQNFRFSPSEIRVKKGALVRIRLTSLDMQHDLVIDELGVRTPVTVAGEASEVEFVAQKSGRFEYYCSVGSHRANGMVGTLIVE